MKASDLIMTDKPHRKRRGLQVTFTETKRDLQASDLEVLRDLQNCCQCSSSEASKMLRTTKESDLETPRRKRKRFGPKAVEGMCALLGFASFLAESETGKKSEVGLQEPIHRLRSSTNKAKSLLKRTGSASQQVKIIRETQTSGDGLFGYTMALGDCAFTQRLHHLLDSLQMPRCMFTPAVLYHRSEHSEAQGKPTSTASHISVAAFIKSSLGTLS